MTAQEIVIRRLRTKDKKKVITAICRFVDCGQFQLDEEKDILSQFCLDVLPVTSRRFRLGFTFVDNLKVPLFSRLMVSPSKNLASLETAYEISQEVYSPENIKNSVPAVIFEANSQYFVYSRVGSADGTVMILRWRNQTRFIYPLQDYLLAMGATNIAPE